MPTLTVYLTFPWQWLTVFQFIIAVLRAQLVRYIRFSEPLAEIQLLKSCSLYKPCKNLLCLPLVGLPSHTPSLSVSGQAHYSPGIWIFVELFAQGMHHVTVKLGVGALEYNSVIVAVLPDCKLFHWDQIIWKQWGFNSNNNKPLLFREHGKEEGSDRATVPRIGREGHN